MDRQERKDRTSATLCESKHWNIFHLAPNQPSILFTLLSLHTQRLPPITAWSYLAERRGEEVTLKSIRKLMEIVSSESISLYHIQCICLMGKKRWVRDALKKKKKKTLYLCASLKKVELINWRNEIIFIFREMHWRWEMVLQLQGFYDFEGWMSVHKISVLWGLQVRTKRLLVD